MTTPVLPQLPHHLHQPLRGYNRGFVSPRQHPGEEVEEFGEADGHAEATVADYLDQMPLTRLGTVEDIAYMVRYFIGPESGWVTGQVVNADGGHSVRRGPDLGHTAAAFGASQTRPWPGAVR